MGDIMTKAGSRRNKRPIDYDGVTENDFLEMLTYNQEVIIFNESDTLMAYKDKQGQVYIFSIEHLLLEFYFLSLHTDPINGLYDSSGSASYNVLFDGPLDTGLKSKKHKLWGKGHGKT